MYVGIQRFFFLSNLGRKNSKAHLGSAQWTSFIQSLYFCSENEKGTCHIIGGKVALSLHICFYVSSVCFLPYLLWQSETPEGQTAKKLRNALGSHYCCVSCRCSSFSWHRLTFRERYVRKSKHSQLKHGYIVWFSRFSFLSDTSRKVLGYLEDVTSHHTSTALQWPAAL